MTRKSDKAHEDFIVRDYEARQRKEPNSAPAPDLADQLRVAKKLLDDEKRKKIQEQFREKEILRIWGEYTGDTTPNFHLVPFRKSHEELLRKAWANQPQIPNTRVTDFTKWLRTLYSRKSSACAREAGKKAEEGIEKYSRKRTHSPAAMCFLTQR